MVEVGAIDKWTIDIQSLGSDGLSTCQAQKGTGKGHQALRTYAIIVNRTNPLNYTLGLSSETLVEIGRAHEQTHALSDLSYTANNKMSHLATWNDDDGNFKESCDASAAHQKRAEDLWNIVDRDNHLSSKMKEVMLSRISYGGTNMIDIDTVVNELCLVAGALEVSLLSPSIRALIDFADLNLGFRAIGRKMQEEQPKLRAY